MKNNYKGLYSLLLIVFTSFLVLGACSSDEKVNIIEKPINSSNDIVAITDSLVIPYVYTSAVSLNNLPVAEKKSKFFEMMLPAVLVAKKEISIKLQRVIAISNKPSMSSEDSIFIENLKTKYKATNIEMLKSRLHTFPVSIVLAQSAIESGWGTSRFFLEANNPFGLWSFDPKQQRIEASSTRNGTKVYLRKFNNLEEAIEAYYTTLATAGPFTAFRAARLKTNDPYDLVNYLIDYSERREAYVNEVKGVMRGNDLVKYDTYKIDPKYISN
jgi:Bax protein